MRHYHKPKRRHSRLAVVSIILTSGIIVFLVYQNTAFITSTVQKSVDVPQKTVGQITSQSKQLLNEFEKESSQVPNSNTVPSPAPQTQASGNISPINIDQLEQQVHDLINQQRQTNGLKPLVFDTQLVAIAQAHSQDMLINNYFDHNSLDGSTLLNRMNNAHYSCFGWSGENIEENYISQQDLADSIVQTWMNSPEHRDNILNVNFGREGIGIATDSNNVLITEDFC